MLNQKRSRVQYIVNELCELDKQGREQIDSVKRSTLQLELNQMFEDKAKGAFIRSRRKWRR